jgi:putative membrane protein
MKITFVLAATCILLSAPAFAQSTTTPHITGPAPTNTTTSTPEFVSKAILSNMFVVQSARLAGQKGDSQERNFARQDVPDHTKAMDDLKMMVNTGKVNAQIPTALDSEHQQKFAELQNLWGKSFDEAYSKDQLQAYRNEIGLFEHYAQNGDNAALRQWATKMLPDLKNHLIYAEMLG